MKYSQLFTKTTKNNPKDETAISAINLLKAGFIYKEMAGVYDFLPLGKRVLDKIVEIIREEMNGIGGQELGLTALQNPENWEKTGRISDEKIDVWFKTELKNGTTLPLGCTHEEPITSMMSKFISSYKDLPVAAYQFQTKFRNEVRAKNGILRMREFLMKDLYSFSASEEEHNEYYEKAVAAYLRIFEKLGIGEFTFRTFADGAPFTDFSDEFQVVCKAGEDTIYIDREKGIALNKEVYNDEVIAKLGLNRDTLEEAAASEVGNTFSLGTKYSSTLGCNFSDKDGQLQSCVMGCYGIGPGRTMGVIAELLSDYNGLVWPKQIAPYHVYLISIGDDGKVMSNAQKIYDELWSLGVEVLWDDRDVSAGNKFGDADLMGIPVRLVVSKRLNETGEVELKERSLAETKNVSVEKIVEKVSVMIHS